MPTLPWRNEVNAFVVAFPSPSPSQSLYSRDHRQGLAEMYLELDLSLSRVKLSGVIGVGSAAGSFRPRNPLNSLIESVGSSLGEADLSRFVLAQFLFRWRRRRQE